MKQLVIGTKQVSVRAVHPQALQAAKYAIAGNMAPAACRLPPGS